MDKNTLKQYRSIIREIDDLEAEKQKVLDRLLAPPVADDMPHVSGNKDKIGDAVARRDKYQRMIDAKLDELIGLREAIEEAIDVLPSSERTLIRLRYIDGLRFENIAVEMHYSIQHIWRMHGNVLNKMREHER